MMLLKNTEGDDIGKIETYYEFASGYYISKTLKVYNTNTETYSTINPVSLNVWYKLNGVSKQEKVQNIAARIFLTEEPGKKYVVFKDGDTNNRHISNLIRTSDKNKYFNRYEEKIVKEEVFVDGIPEIKDVRIRNAGEKGLFASEYSKIYSAKVGGHIRALNISRRSTGTTFLARNSGDINCNILTMRAFYPDEKEKTFVLYKDGCVSNTHYTNYIWSDKPEFENEFEGILPGYPHYKFSRNGACKSYVYKEPRLLKPQMDEEGYFFYHLYRENGNKYTVRRNRIVATIFLPNPDNLPEVDHNNKKRWDDRVENLSWVTYSENNHNKDKEEISKKFFKPVLQFDLEGNFLNKFKNAKEARAFLFQNHGILASRDDIQKCCCANKKNGNVNMKKPTSFCEFLWYYSHEKEIYELKEGEKAIQFVGDFGHKKYDFPSYKITNFGNIINSKGFVLNTQLRNGYSSVTLRKKNVRVHRPVAFFFVNGRTDERKWVNHKDENRANPHYLNLEWVTPSENTNHSKHKNEKPVDQFNMDTGEFIKRFKSGSFAAKEIGCGVNSINKVCRKEEGTLFGFMWRFADITTENPDAIKVPSKDSKVCKKVNKYDTNGKFLTCYPSVTKAAKIDKKTVVSISKCCRGEIKKTRDGYIYRFADLSCMPGVDLTEF